MLKQIFYNYTKLDLTRHISYYTEKKGAGRISLSTQRFEVELDNLNEV